MDLASELVCELLEPEQRVNKQLFENSILNGSQVDKDYQSNPNALYGKKTPNLAIINEKPEHRLILILKLRGLSNREIAKHSGYTEPWVSQVSRQPWFQQRLVELLAEKAEEPISEIFRIESVNSVNKLIELRDTSPHHEIQVKCALSILDRHLGKPVQRQEIQQTVVHSVLRLEDVDAQLRELERQENELLIESGIAVNQAEAGGTVNGEDVNSEKLRVTTLQTTQEAGSLSQSGEVQAEVRESREPLREVDDGLRGGLLLADGGKAILQT